MSSPPEGARVQAWLIAHTWGTETVLVVEGSAPGATYDVFVEDRSGGRLTSGSFLGTGSMLDCEMNAAVLREDAAALLITVEGQEWSRAELPEVRS